MSYAAKANMLARFGEPEVIALTDRANLGVVDDTVLAGALAEADAEIDPYLAPRHTLPLASVPKILTGFACDIARYRLCGSGGVTETEEIRNRYKDAVKFLEKVAEGKIGLGLDALNNIAKPANTVQFSAPGSRVFDRGSRG
jgi:phage gp36-like protein